MVFALDDNLPERRPPGHELTAEEEREVNRLMVNGRLATEVRDLETYRIAHCQLVRFLVGSSTPAGSAGGVRPGRGTVEESSTVGRGLKTGRGRR